MLIIRGVYEHGEIRLLEPVPPQVKEAQEVTVTFIEPQPVSGSTSSPAKRTEATNAALLLIGLLKTLTAEQMAAFDAALERRSSFFGPREVAW